MFKKYSLLYILLLTISYGCPYTPNPIPTPFPTPDSPLPTHSLSQYLNYKVEFGPGTKGPGTISDNLVFTVNFSDTLLQPALKGFKIQNLKLNDLIINLFKDNQNIITATVVPNQKLITFTTGVEPGIYKVFVKVENENPILEMSGSLIEVRQDYKTDVKVVLYTKEIDENSLDIEILSRIIKN